MMKKKKENTLKIDENGINRKVLREIFMKVFRDDFLEPGFVCINLGKKTNSNNLRELMVDLKNGLSKLLINKEKRKLNYQWMGRFDQQESTKFHRDNAAEESYLMLGYEPSKVRSKLYFADYSKLISDMDLSEKEYYENYNPMNLKGEKQLKPYITKVDNFDIESYMIVLMNNSALSSKKELGVMHMAVIPEKNSSESRIINSTMIYSTEMDEVESFTDKEQKEFTTTSQISK